MRRTWWMAMVCCAALVMMFAGPARGLVVGFEQVDWGDGIGGYNAQNSDWGRASVLFEPGDDSLFTFTGSAYEGWLQIVTTVSGGSADNWAVQNVPFVFNSVGEFSDRLADGLMFDLGTSVGADVTSLDYLLSITSAPLASAPVGVMSSVGVSDTNFIFGGLDGMSGADTFTGGTDAQAPPAANNTQGATAATDKTGGTGKISGKETDVPAINEELNGCAPASAARSLHYLKNVAGLTLGSPTETPQNTYELLKIAMGTIVGKDERGTLVADFVTGKDIYADVLDVDVMSTMTGRTDMDFMNTLTKLNNKGDVEALIYWGKDGNGDSMGGHAAFVSEIIKITDAAGMVTGYKVTIIDDRPQGDGVASNKKTVLQFNADGTLKGYGTGAALIGFVTEMVIPEPAGGLMILGLGSLLIRRRAA